jgi:glycosyltransferase involved in cell wall biosynthesis
MRLVIVANDPIEAYEKKGIASWLGDYYNPNSFFEEVYVLSPIEKTDRIAYGLRIIPVRNSLHFRKLVREIKPDLIRAYGGYWPADFVVLNKMPTVPIIVSVHDTNPDLIHKSVKYADHVICMTKAVQEEVIKNTGVKITRTSILGNRVDTELFKRATNSSRINQIRSEFPEGRMILHIGRKSNQKNLETLVGALKYLPADFFCVFIGQGDSSEYLNLANNLGVNNRCYWISSVENSDLPFWYNACDLFCVLSRWEGFGLVFIEAAASEALILTSDISPMNDILDADSCFLMNEYENPGAVAQKISEIFLMDRISLLKIKENARKKSLTYDKSVIEFNEIEIYKSVIEKGLQKEYPGSCRWRLVYITTVEYKKLKKLMKNLLKNILNLFKLV